MQYTVTETHYYTAAGQPDCGRDVYLSHLNRQPSAAKWSEFHAATDTGEALEGKCQLFAGAGAKSTTIYHSGGQPYLEQ